MNRKGADQTALMRSKAADQTALMHRPICDFVVRIWHKTDFLTTRLNYTAYVCCSGSVSIE